MNKIIVIFLLLLLPCSASFGNNIFNVDKYFLDRDYLSQSYYGVRGINVPLDSRGRYLIGTMVGRVYSQTHFLNKNGLYILLDDGMILASLDEKFYLENKKGNKYCFLFTVRYLEKETDRSTLIKSSFCEGFRLG